MANLRRSLIINFFSTSGSTVLKFAVSVILARMLSPSEIGVYSMTLVFVNFAHVFRDFGVTQYLQREAELTPDKIRSATGVVYTTSWLIALGLFLASDALGKWFAEPEIVPVMRVLALGFVLIPFGSITSALLVREFAAEKQAIVNAVGTISFCVSCLLLAKLGFGSMSLAWANLINIAACVIAYIPLRPAKLPWLPSIAHWRSVVHFGAGSLLANMAGAINNSIPDILLGKLGSAAQVGLLSRANSTVQIFLLVAGSTVNYGAISYLAQIFHRGESLVPMLTRATVLLTGIGWAALVLTAVLGEDIVTALYGPTWVTAVPAILPLALAAAVAMMSHYIPPAVLAIGRPYLSALPTLGSLAARIAFGVLMYDGSLERFAWALCAATIVTMPLVLYMQDRYFSLGLQHLLRALAPSAVVALGTGAAALLLQAVVPATLAPLLRLLIMALPLAAVWYLLLRLTRHELVDEVHRLAAPIKARLALLRPNP
ncbi:O-antigen/teichoic acid export membrane protein [Massilia aurea]|uniref:O-antigen/teichoic acid export membrane protein n=1 Tax=Massilia aurea TaxID=373040 RepID=A0A7W9X0R2_9BURK|nr:oligosaccharide flippase family protein [Massilia aurea]MBB6134301.1 O-antigen/teichoic acid export membrane protein [Massilia aurea]